MGFEALSDEIFVHILCNLEPPSLLRALTVSRRFYNIIRYEKRVWAGHVLLRDPKSTNVQNGMKQELDLPAVWLNKIEDISPFEPHLRRYLWSYTNHINLFDEKFVKTMIHVLGEMRSIQIRVQSAPTWSRDDCLWTYRYCLLYDLLDSAQQVAAAVATGSLEIAALRESYHPPEDTVTGAITKLRDSAFEQTTMSGTLLTMKLCVLLAWIYSVSVRLLQPQELRAQFLRLRRPRAKPDRLRVELKKAIHALLHQADQSMRLDHDRMECLLEEMVVLSWIGDIPMVELDWKLYRAQSVHYAQPFQKPWRTDNRHPAEIWFTNYKRNQTLAKLEATEQDEVGGRIGYLTSPMPDYTPSRAQQAVDEGNVLLPLIYRHPSLSQHAVVKDGR